MELFPVELRKTLPPLYSQESCPTPIVHVKLFTPDSSFTWFITEREEQEDGDWLLFGLVIGLEEEWGYSLLSEIASARGSVRLAGRTGPLVQARSGRSSTPPRASVRRGDGRRSAMSEKVQSQTNVPIDVALKSTMAGQTDSEGLSWIEPESVLWTELISQLHCCFNLRRNSELLSKVRQWFGLPSMF